MKNLKMVIGAIIAGSLWLWTPFASASTSTKPVLASLHGSAKTVRAGGSETITWALSDPSGIEQTDVIPLYPGASNELQDCTAPKLISGDATDGTYQDECRIPWFAPDGTYILELYAQDNVGNYIYFNRQGFTVEGGKVAGSPAIDSTSVSSRTITAGRIEKLSWTVTAPGWTEQTDGVVETAAGQPLQSCGTARLVAGNRINGTFYERCSILKGAPTGVYTFTIYL